jgi:hypothetical protein
MMKPVRCNASGQVSCAPRWVLGGVVMLLVLVLTACPAPEDGVNEPPLNAPPAALLHHV